MNKISGKLLALGCAVCSTVCFYTVSYALDMNRMKTFFLKGNYAECIKEGEKILAGEKYSQQMDELYLLLGMSYLKEDNYLRASDIFEIILNEFRHSKLKAEALLGLGDSYFMMNDFSKAEKQYKAILDDFPEADLKPSVYFRLNQLFLKKSDTSQAQEYALKLQQECPLSPEVRLKNISFKEFFYCVQVGSFSKGANAWNLVEKLKDKGYGAYLEKFDSNGKTNYRVRVGKVSSRKEAEELANKLSLEGYPTKIFP